MSATTDPLFGYLLPTSWSEVGSALGGIAAVIGVIAAAVAADLRGGN